MNDDCIFCKIIKKDLPAKIVFEDKEFIVFCDKNPIAKLHLLLVTRTHIESLQNISNNDSEWLGRMISIIPKLAIDNGCKDGFRIVSNAGINSGQEVPHLHFHILGGRDLHRKML
ncbi:cell-cycle regulation hit-like protein [Candidatus Kinetoplastibacterium oncopeltii TCC290E]|uniref:Cell-cycle regulation hit-like protein n=1 Tax=Candidatus Kinetoplastidibacterium stringomonadis TCC290E TaxID=1208920 RepID=M1LR28_9PROT|nr:histidine triad nucleotide-binding protein [Candidatus Kinetoplastibacterium oncopeltii]AGF48047.1 cell-cycle regulation hit-like protein [Candidatus Kinetoplastibacterium oncopeltii TCC290E]